MLRQYAFDFCIYVIQIKIKEIMHLKKLTQCPKAFKLVTLLNDTKNWTLLFGILGTFWYLVISYYINSNL
jgi:hypothetical protein